MSFPLILLSRNMREKFSLNRLSSFTAGRAVFTFHYPSRYPRYSQGLFFYCFIWLKVPSSQTFSYCSAWNQTVSCFLFFCFFKLRVHFFKVSVTEVACQFICFFNTFSLPIKCQLLLRQLPLCITTIKVPLNTCHNQKDLLENTKLFLYI